MVYENLVFVGLYFELLYINIENFACRCVLAALTMDHRLCIYSRNRGKKWVQVVEPSKLLNEHMASNDFDTADSHIIQDRPKDISIDLWNLKNRSYLLASVTMVRPN